MSADAEKLDLNAVIVDSLKRFKGLESLVVILVINRNMANEPELAYVAVSRAKTRLYILGNISGTALDNAVRRARLWLGAPTASILSMLPLNHDQNS